MFQSKKALALLVFPLAAIGLGISIGIRAYVDDELGQRDCADTLRPIASLIDENSRLLSDLKLEGLADSDGVRLDEFMLRIRRDGVPLHTDSKRRIDALINNNTAILTLMTRYEPRARTDAFRASADSFRDYAILLRDRWQSSIEMFMADGSAASVRVAAAPDLRGALVVETAALR